MRNPGTTKHFKTRTFSPGMGQTDYKVVVMKLGSLIWLLDAVIAAEEDDVLSGHEAGDAVLTVGRCYGWSLSQYGPSSSAAAAHGVGGKPDTTLVFFLSLFFS